MTKLVPAVLVKTAEEYQQRLSVIRQLTNRFQLDIIDGEYVDNKTIELDDVARANVLAMKADCADENFNIGMGIGTSINELVTQLLELTGSTSPITSLPLPTDDPRQRQPDITLARSALEWEPKVALQDGLKETIGYFRKLLAS